MEEAVMFGDDDNTFYSINLEGIEIILDLSCSDLLGLEDDDN